MGRVDGIVVFVAGAAPQERVRARVLSRKARFIEAEVVEVLQPSTARREPPCPIANQCGGCSWQHVTYSEQLKQKQGILESSLRGLIKYRPFEILPMLGAPAEFNYRNRIQVHVEGSRLGFFAKGSHRLVETRECAISEPLINERLAALNAADLAGARRIELALDELTGQVVLRRDRDPQAALFGQVNRLQNEVLLKLVLSAIAGRPSWMLDLYAGSGNISIPLSAAFPDTPVHAVELSRESVQIGKAKGIAGIEWSAQDVAEFLRGFKCPKGEGCVVLDPPRPGCDVAVIQSLKRLSPKQIVYVSCNPSTFARDAERLIQDGQYSVATVQGLDMFPQTEHIELIASFFANETPRI